MLAIHLVFPNGNQRAIGEAEQSKQNQENAAVVKIHRHLGETKDRDARGEEQSNAEFFGHAQGVLPMKKLMGKQVDENRPEQKQARFELGRSKQLPRESDATDENGEPDAKSGPTVVLIKQMAPGLHIFAGEPPTFDPAIGGVGEPDSRGQNHVMKPRQSGSGRLGEKPLPHDCHSGCVERKDRRPLPPTGFV